MSGERPGGKPRFLPGMIAEVTALLLVFLLKLQCRSWTVSRDGVEALDRLQGEGKGVLVAFWHGKYPALFPLLLGLPGCAFVSRSFRGSVIAALCRRLGFEAVLISSRSQGRVLEQMREALRRHRIAGIAVDGPQGPRHEMKSGIFRLTSELGWSILPVSVASRPRRVLQGRWDRMEIPRFFSRVALVVGEPMTVPAHLSEEDLRRLKKRLHDALEDAGRRAEENLDSR